MRTSILNLYFTTTPREHPELLLYKRHRFVLTMKLDDAADDPPVERRSAGRARILSGRPGTA